MKKAFILLYALAGLLPVVGLRAAEVRPLPYQAVVRDAEGQPLANEEVTARFYIRRQLSSRADAEPATLYSETHTAVSDADGWVRLEVGSGTPLSGTYEAVDWWGNVYVDVELELSGGERAFAATQQLGTVPYARSAESALLLTSPDGTRWSVACDNEGNLTTVPVPARFTRLVFSDEFDQPGMLDESKWTYEEGYVRNGEEQYYTVARRENCYIGDDGYLHMVCRNDSALIEDALYEKPWGEGGSHGYRKDTIIPITSASVNTKGKFAFTYGRVEVRAKLPVCLGSWPAIWMFAHDRSDWPACGEIDIMEHVGYDADNVYFTLHSTELNGNNQPNRYAGSADFDDPTGWHVFAFEWHPDRMMWYVDGVQEFTVIRSREYSDSNWPFHVDFYFMLNLAFGGGWGGREGIDVDALPIEYLIDYVRIYQ